jgi:hypothetical protein
LLDEARQALKQLAIDARDLEEAMKQFGPGLDQAKFTSVFERRAEDREAAKLINQLQWPLNQVINQVNIVLAHSAVLAGLPGITTRSSMPQVHAAPLRARIISRHRLNELTRLNRVRNALQHRYGVFADAREIHAAAVLVARLIKRFGADFGPWLTATGVVIPPTP